MDSINTGSIVEFAVNFLPWSVVFEDPYLTQALKFIAKYQENINKPFQVFSTKILILSFRTSQLKIRGTDENNSFTKNKY
mmetsp:Transcript_23266/g.48690  ORF Transcript_23266/g.48690 Transcript_23266/m.48690 type:complete len:80 (+) Transcript_23266:1028-1267(+)